MSGETSSGRADSTARTRAAIVDAATELFAERGFGAVSLREVAAAAGISHPGLLRHFGSKDLLLRDVVAGLNGLGVDEDTLDEDPPLDVFVEVARRNAETAGYSELLSGLLGLAASPEHPVHAELGERYAVVRRRFAALFERRAAELVAGVDADVEAICFAAAWDGLQLISRYLPAVDVPGALATRLELLRGHRPEGRPAAVAPSTVSTQSPAPETPGYAPGRERRRRTLDAATAMFAHAGYHGTSLRDIAERVGTGKSTLVHHFGTKEQLLIAVLQNRDANTAAVVSGLVGNAADRLRELPGWVRRDLALEPGLVGLYATLSTEAAARSHPAHDYFADRYAQVIGALTDRFRQAAAEGDLAGWRDPAFEALWLVSLWDGLQLQWLYDPDAVDVAGLLRLHLATLLEAR